ncbi:MATE family efflux transporter [Thalassotalea agarivorans]|uniref:Multidrug-efflux transporter n=1 Tax=Thalassotalea agarivorans TaxID=349064 RepID=A0A1I0EQM1_THASX|nr:MATE family efflux transporter [Thalassotalea agarivorans]SET47499.1 multidrug resistance protein, MATE family [Thalassotalea agarivorans]
MTAQKIFNDIKSLSKLAYPILIAQLVQNLMGFADTVMAGRVSATDMAAVAVASSVWLPLILLIYGIVMALAAIVSQLAGAQKYDAIAKPVAQAGWIALILSLSLILLFYGLIPNLHDIVKLEDGLEVLMFDYLLYVVWGAPGFCLYLVLRNYAEGMSHTKPTMIISLIGLAINVPANYIFIYGEFGAPALGGAGCGIATAIVYWVMFIGMLIYVLISKKLQQAELFKQFYWPNWDEMMSILRIGVPIALSLLFEVTLFAVAALFLAPFGSQVVASHQIAINFSSLVFMVPLSIAMAVTIKVGFSVGKREFEQAKQMCVSALVLGFLIACFTASLSVLFRHQIAAIYTHEVPVIELAASLMFLAALFQFSDFIQVICAGALRGYKDTKAILYITFVSYWPIGLAIGCILGLTDYIVPSMGPSGFWIGFIVGLTVAAILLSIRLRYIQKQIETGKLVVSMT